MADSQNVSITKLMLSTRLESVTLLFYQFVMLQNEIYGPSMKKSLPANNKRHDNSLKNYENVDLDHVYIEFKQEFHKWTEGEHVVKKVD